MEEIDIDLLAAEKDAEKEIEPQASHATSHLTRLATAPTRECEAPGALSNVDLQRVATYATQHRVTVGSRHGTATLDEWPSFGAGKSYPPEVDDEAYVVQFTGPDDPTHPQNWTLRRK